MYQILALKYFVFKKIFQPGLINQTAVETGKQEKPLSNFLKHLIQ